MSEIANRIFKAMCDADMSYGELSRITGIPKSALQRYATGETSKIPIPRVEMIADALNVSADYLLGWSDTPIKKPTQMDELREEVLNLLVDLPVRDLFRVMEFAAELKAARGVEEARRK